MKIYEVHSELFGGAVRMTFNEPGVLIRFEAVNQDVDKLNYDADQQVPSIRLRLTLSGFLSMCEAYRLKPLEISREITFDMFWDKYAYKVDKPLAMEAWNKLTKEDQLAAFDFIPRYNAQLKQSGLARKYAVRYLKHKPWIQ